LLGQVQEVIAAQSWTDIALEFLSVWFECTTAVHIAWAAVVFVMLKIFAPSCVIDASSARGDSVAKVSSERSGTNPKDESTLRFLQ
jgi:hypothetical protein